MESEGKLEHKLASRKIKPTAIRLLVLQQLMKYSSAISLAELEDSFDRADRITLYRTLKTFEKNKLVHSINDGTGVTKYALCMEGCECSPEDFHAHFHCIVCKETFCMAQTDLPKVQLPINFALTEIDMVIKGVCGNCRT